MRRLRTDYVDVYHLHAVRHDAYPDLRDRIVPVLERLREQGKLRFLGITEGFASDPSHRMLELALCDGCWDVAMVGFNILNQSARRRVLPLAAANNVGILVMFAVRRALSQPARLRELLADIAQKRGIRVPTQSELETMLRQDGASSLPDAAYRFCRFEPGVHVVLSGTRRLEHLQQNAASFGKEDLAPDARDALVRLFEGIDNLSGH